MFRYLERAENIGRLVDVGFRMALTRGDIDAQSEWRSVIATSGLKLDYEAKFGKDYSGQQVFNYLLRDRDNPGSALSIIEQARTNARMVRAGLTQEVWEATNETWMQMKDVLARPVRESTLGPVLDIINRQSNQVRGAMMGSMLRNEIFNFARIGKFLERADNTARILDVKYYVLLPAVSYVGSSLDNVQWENVLRSVSAERAYSWLNAGRMDARSIAEFLILDGRFPRSLAFCYNKLRSNLASLAREHGGEQPSHELMRDSDVKLQGTTIEDIFEQGLHEFIEDFLGCNIQLADQIATDFRFVE